VETVTCFGSRIRESSSSAALLAVDGINSPSQEGFTDMQNRIAGRKDCFQDIYDSQRNEQKLIVSCLIHIADLTP
jgi:hypothetical protein